MHHPTPSKTHLTLWVLLQVPDGIRGTDFLFLLHIHQLCFWWRHWSVVHCHHFLLQLLSLSDPVHRRAGQRSHTPGSTMQHNNELQVIRFYESRKLLWPVAFTVFFTLNGFSLSNSSETYESVLHMSSHVIQLQPNEDSIDTLFWGSSHEVNVLYSNYFFPPYVLHLPVASPG